MSRKGREGTKIWNQKIPEKKSELMSALKVHKRAGRETPADRGFRGRKDRAAGERGEEGKTGEQIQGRM